MDGLLTIAGLDTEQRPLSFGGKCRTFEPWDSHMKDRRDVPT
jgi:hypothetical protein